MTTVLTRTLISTGIIILLNTLVYFFTVRSTNKEIITITSALALFCAIPVILGYVLTFMLMTYNNIVLYYVNIALLFFNGCLIILASLLTFGIATEFTYVLWGFGYIVIGAYVFFETVKILGQANQQQNKKNLSDGDLLDDGF